MVNEANKRLKVIEEDSKQTNSPLDDNPFEYCMNFDDNSPDD